MPTQHLIANRRTKTLRIELDDVASFFQNLDLVNNIEGNTMRYVTLFSEAIDKLMPKRTISSIDDIAQNETFDIFIDQVLQRQEEQNQAQMQQRNQQLLTGEHALQSTTTTTGQVAVSQTAEEVQQKPSFPKELLRR